MAVFLLISLVLLGFGAFFSPKAQGEIAALGEPRSSERGVFGGPAHIPGGSARFSEDRTMLASQPLPDPTVSSADTSRILTNQAVFQIAALQGASGPGPSTSRNSEKQPAGLANEAGALDPKNYFILPTQGFNWGKIHPRNAVDIANSCGAPAVASAQGLVADISLDSWSGGYGHYIVLSHPNGMKTHYAHLDQIFVSLGQYVKQSDLIGTVGRTGDASGCHVHFEVEGAANPFARS